MTANDTMGLEDIHDEIWELDAKCNKEETIGTTHDINNNKVEKMTKDD